MDDLPFALEQYLGIMQSEELESITPNNEADDDDDW